MQLSVQSRWQCAVGANSRQSRLVCRAQQQQQQPQQTGSGRREVILRSVNAAVLGALFTFGASPRPGTLGIQDYGGGLKTLSLCPPTPTCVATSEEGNDITHYVPPLTFNPEDGRGSRKPASQQQAMKELQQVVSSIKPDGWTPTIIKKTDEYLYVEYQSPWLGFIDDVEFWFKAGPGSRVEYRSASRVGFRDSNVNRKRIKALRQALERKGWASTGF